MGVVAGGQGNEPMSASLDYIPADLKGHDIPASAPQMFMDMLAEAFGDRTPELDKANLARLIGMKIGTSDKQMKLCFEALIEGIEKYGRIQVRASY
jgi:hypothetical protein